MAANLYLSGLTVSTGTLSPTFANTTFAYTVAVSSATTSITVTPTQSVGGSTIKVNGTTVTSGNASGAIALAVGSSTITIVVTKAGNTTETYVITVDRISYAGSPFTFNAGTPITTASSTEMGNNPISYSGTLPPGLTLNTSTGDITGRPL